MQIQFAKMRVMEDTHGGYDGNLSHMLLGDAVHDEPMLQNLADQAGPSGSGAEPNGEAEDEAEEPPSKRSKGKGKGKAGARRSG